jgi:2-polyprenyl-3-methyl-5-hydroxy-6-metoxy-1,4-benzoquinol methylase
LFREEAGFVIVACDGCGLRHLSPQPDAATLDALYAESYYHSEDPLARGYGRYAAEADNWRATFRDRLRRLPPGRRVLDVGAAAGFFVEQARLAGRDAEGVEPSAWAAAYARDVLGQPVRTATLAEAAYADAAFDGLTMWEVIEHLPDPTAVLAEARRVVAPGGWLALSTPDAESLAARLSGARWLGWRKVPEHLWFFGAEHLVRLLAASGFEVVARRYVSLTVTAGFALERLGSLLGVPGLPRLAGPLRGCAVPINPGYDLMLVARRRP